MNPHFFTAPFYFAFIWFRVQGSGFKVQGLRFRVEVAARRLFLEDGILVSSAFPSRVMLSDSILGTLTYCKIFFPLFFL